MVKRNVDILSLVGLTVLVFFYVCQAGYISWDDYRFVVDNPLMVAPFKQAFSGIWGSFFLGDYTPLPLASYWLEVALCGKIGAVHHGVNIAFHLLNIFLLHRLLKREKVGDLLRFVMCLLFAIHPLQVESVAWITDRNGLMNGTAVLLALCSLQNAKRGAHPYLWHGAYAVFMVLAALSKATAVFLPLALGGALWLSVENRRWTLLSYHLGVFACISLPLAFVRRMALMSKVGSGWDINTIAGRLPELCLQVPTAIGHYVATFFWPMNLAAIYPNFSQLGQAWMPLWITGVGFSLLWLVYGGIRRQFYDIFAILWFFLLLAPILNIFPRANFVNDRYMYLPIIGITYGVGAMIGSLGGFWPAKAIFLRLPRSFALGLTAILALLCAWVSSQRSRVWCDNELFWQDVTTKTPQSPLGWNNLAMTAKAMKQYSKAGEALLHALQLERDPTSPRQVIWRNLGDLYLAQGEWPQGFSPKKAIEAYTGALAEIDQADLGSRALLMLKYAIALVYDGRPAEARGLLQQLAAPGAPVPADVAADAGHILQSLTK